MKRELTKKELHNLAMNIVGKDLENNKFEFVAINSELKRHPQFVCIDKDAQYYFVIVKYLILPNNPLDYDTVWMETFISHAKSKNARVIYAGVGLRDVNNQGVGVLLNEDYLLDYKGYMFVS